ncbi:hypothetical protein LCGC14_1707610 [marine sediment metagenome]|uniref:Uncharacterized protein n=1 Tax=marine sediment metagenome TaxID=412755 RepID=A0A0F9I3S1_9ZZZZ
MIYRLIKHDHEYESFGFEYFGNKRLARKARKEFEKNTPDSCCRITLFETPKTKRDVILLLNRIACHNG